MSSYKIFLCASADSLKKGINVLDSCFYSIEAGLHDGLHHWDHHGVFAGQPCPVNNPAISPMGEGKNVILITHLDTDCFVGVLRLLGKRLPEVDLALLEKIDLNGSSIKEAKGTPTLAYFVGLGEAKKEVGIPQCTQTPQDVTFLVDKLITYPPETLIALGEKAIKDSEEDYISCLKEKGKRCIFFCTSQGNHLNPSRAYEDGFEVVLVYRLDFGTASIYCVPTGSLIFGGKTVGGIPFAGQARACGSPRGVRLSMEEIQKVWAELLALVG